jgi:methyl-accepting chemotaxis protein
VKVLGLPIGLRIAGGFGASMLLLVGLAGAVQVGLGAISSSFGMAAREAEGASLVAAFSLAIAQDASSIDRFLRTRQDGDADAAKSNAAATALTADKMATALANHPRADQISQLVDDQKRFSADLDMLIGKVRAASEQEEVLGALADPLEGMLTEAIKVAVAADPAATDPSMIATSAFAALKSEVASYISSRDPAALDNAHNALAALLAAVEDIRTVLSTHGTAQFAERAAEQIKSYGAALDKVAALVQEMAGSADDLGMSAEAMRAEGNSLNAAFQERFVQSRGVLAETIATTDIRVKIITGIALLLAVAAAWVISRSITGPINRMVAAMRRLADRDWSAEVPSLDARDEIGLMARAVQVFKENGLETERLQRELAANAEREAAEQRMRAGAEREAERARLDADEAARREAQARRAEEMNRLATDFEAGVGAVVEAVATAAERMRALAGSMSAAVGTADARASAAAGGARQAATNVETVAAAAEELSASVREITRQVATSSDVARKAVAEVARTDGQVSALADAADRIGEVVRLISDIASQTNLLALNATIEAARAGEMGKGFAVVASEVKTLAKQTARATEEITGQIQAIQGSTQNAVGAIRSIGGTIDQVSSIANTIAAAVEEQGAATQEIARNVQEAHAGTDVVSGSIADVTQATRETARNAAEVLGAADTLAGEASALREKVAAFVAHIRAA